MSIAAGAAAAPLAPSSAAVSPPSTAIGMATWVSSSPRLPEQSTASTTSQNKGPAGDWNLFNAHAISIMSSRNGVSHRVVSFCCSSCTRQCSPMATYRLDVMLSTSPARTLTLTPVSKLLLNVLEGSSTKGIEMIGCSSDRSTPTIGRTTSSLPDDGCGASAAAAAAAAAGGGGGWPVLVVLVTTSCFRTAGRWSLTTRHISVKAASLHWLISRMNSCVCLLAPDVDDSDGLPPR
mmetsp:Transcript_31968/g.92556  ORF Transcript_31968/g.92556 Transcript_31968/m.92556 type:complete len:235 (-) Transcript_31968:199-903(-)